MSRSTRPIKAVLTALREFYQRQAGPWVVFKTVLPVRNDTPRIRTVGRVMALPKPLSNNMLAAVSRLPACASLIGTSTASAPGQVPGA